MVKFQVWLPILLFILIAPITPQIDLAVAKWMYRPDGFIKQADPHHPVYSLLYRFGNRPGQIVGVGAALVALLSYRYQSFGRWRRGAWVIAITATVGAGLLVNGVFKEYWGRPRPKQLLEFGGTESYRPFYSPIWGQRDESFKSFPSGHAAMGFLFLSFALVGWYERQRLLTYSGIVLGTLFGVTLSYGRLVQGGHFVSDTLASALLMWLIAVAACRLIYSRSTLKRPPAD